eukprot:CAMPEP_0117550200 /NCGR_PEP_ID=MMETSP0784-20121206/48558_1 /TAXON_ID=39447 /ORGANISM="" /LENGTH=93 /DNA_ID=CAMNT_0005347211 /DNA_START=58 /DNA_END=339 /DNA_ORIENTATION=-
MSTRPDVHGPKTVLILVDEKSHDGVDTGQFGLNVLLAEVKLPPFLSCGGVLDRLGRLNPAVLPPPSYDLAGDAGRDHFCPWLPAGRRPSLAHH